MQTQQQEMPRSQFNQAASQAHATGKGSGKKVLIWGSVGAVALIVT